MKTIVKVSNRTEVVNIPDGIKRYIHKVMTLDNPKYQEALKYDRWLGDLEPEIKLYEETEDSIIFPRGWTRNCIELLKENGVQFEIQDNRRTLETISLSFQGSLRPYQKAAVKDALQRDFGVVSAATGSGKTIMALAVIAQRGQPTLILCHTKELLYQWRDRIESFLGIEPGLIGDGKFKIQPISVGVINTARKHLDELPLYFGQIIVDECHRTCSAMFTEVVQAFDCRYMLGLSATPYRRDGLTRLIYLTLGDKVHQVDSKELRNNGATLSPEVIRRETSFRYAYEDDYQEMLTALTEDQDRNQLIVNDVIRQSKKGNEVCLVVSDRVAHCQALADMLDNAGLWIEVLTGQTPKRERERIVQDVQTGRVDVLISTVQLLGEGYDCKKLSSLFLASPIKFKGRLLQVVGRILRPADGKRPIVFDYQDVRVGVLKHQAKCRECALSEVVA